MTSLISAEFSAQQSCQPAQPTCDSLPASMRALSEWIPPNSTRLLKSLLYVHFAENKAGRRLMAGKSWRESLARHKGADNPEPRKVPAPAQQHESGRWREAFRSAGVVRLGLTCLAQGHAGRQQVPANQIVQQDEGVGRRAHGLNQAAGRGHEDDDVVVVVVVCTATLHRSATGNPHHQPIQV